MSRLVRLAALLSLLVAAVALTACGGEGDASSARAELRQAFAGGQEVRSGRLDLALRADVTGIPGLGQPIDLQLTGPFQSVGATTLPRFNFELVFGGGSRPVTLGMVSTGKAGFLSLDGQPYDMGADAYRALQQGYAESQRRTAQQRRRTPALAALGVHPDRWVRDPRRVGGEDVAGTATDHLRADVDVDALLTDIGTLLSKSGTVSGATGTTLPTSLTRQQRDAIARSVADAGVEVWVAKADHALRRFALHVRLDAPDDARDQLGGLRAGTISFTATLAELNRPQRITAPADAKPLSALREALTASGLVQDGAAAGADGTSTTPAEPAPTGTQAEYARCLQEAGDDLAKLQRCASILDK